MYGRTLLDNQALSPNALIYLAALILGVPLLSAFSGSTTGDVLKFVPTQSDIDYFRDNYRESLEEMDSEEISEAIANHPNCPEELKHHLADLQDRDY